MFGLSEKPPVSILVRPSILFRMSWENEKNLGSWWTGREGIIVPEH